MYVPPNTDSTTNSWRMFLFVGVLVVVVVVGICTFWYRKHFKQMKRSRDLSPDPNKESLNKKDEEDGS